MPHKPVFRTTVMRFALLPQVVPMLAKQEQAELPQRKVVLELA
jgi:hypothetical protein